MFTGKCGGDVRFLPNPDSQTHWYFLKDKGHCSLLDICPKVPLINTEPSAPCLRKFFCLQSSQKNRGEWKEPPCLIWSEGQSQVWGWPSWLDDEARFCSGSPQFRQDLRPGRHPQVVSHAPSQPALQTVQLHLIFKSQLPRGGAQTGCSVYGKAVSILIGQSQPPERQALFCAPPFSYAPDRLQEDSYSSQHFG